MDQIYTHTHTVSSPLAQDHTLSCDTLGILPYCYSMHTVICFYFRLHLPGPVVEDERSKGSFDSAKGEFIIHLPKANQGQNFENLDMINALLNPTKGPNNTMPNIEIIGTVCIRVHFLLFCFLIHTTKRILLKNLIIFIVLQVEIPLTSPPSS